MYAYLYWNCGPQKTGQFPFSFSTSGSNLDSSCAAVRDSRPATLYEIIKHSSSAASCVDGSSISLPACSRHRIFCAKTSWVHSRPLGPIGQDFGMAFQRGFEDLDSQHLWMAQLLRGLDLLQKVRCQLRFDSFQHVHFGHNLVTRALLIFF